MTLHTLCCKHIIHHMCDFKYVTLQSNAIVWQCQIHFILKNKWINSNTLSNIYSSKIYSSINIVTSYSKFV